jgi:multicomponent Na+:H+ antiporter subunit C
MTVVLALVIGGLYAAGFYLMLRRNLAQLILGLSLLTSASNLLIFTVGGLTRARPPLIPTDRLRPLEGSADPVPQALILTSIVIGFGVLAFTMALSYRVDQAVPSDDLNEMMTSDDLDPENDPPSTAGLIEATTLEPERVAPEEAAAPASEL